MQQFERVHLIRCFPSDFFSLLPSQGPMTQQLLKELEFYPLKSLTIEFVEYEDYCDDLDDLHFVRRAQGLNPDESTKLQLDELLAQTRSTLTELRVISSSPLFAFSLLENVSNLEKVEVRLEDADDKQWHGLLRALRACPQLREITLSSDIYPEFGYSSVPELPLTQLLQSNSLESISLQNIQPPPRSFFEALKSSTTVRKLVLENRHYNALAPHLARMLLENSTLEDLTVSIADTRGIISILSTLEETNRCLRRLKFEGERKRGNFPSCIVKTLSGLLLKNQVLEQVNIPGGSEAWRSTDIQYNLSLNKVQRCLSENPSFESWSVVDTRH